MSLSNLWQWYMWQIDSYYIQCEWYGFELCPLVCDVNRHHHLFMPAFFILFDFGMWRIWPGNVTWEWDLGMRPGNVIWQSQRPTIPKESSESQTLLPLLRRTGNETRCTRYLGACWSISCSRGGRVLSRTWLITTSGLLPNSFRHSWTRHKCQG